MLCNVLQIMGLFLEGSGKFSHSVEVLGAYIFLFLDTGFKIDFVSPTSFQGFRETGPGTEHKIAIHQHIPLQHSKLRSYSRILLQ